MTRTRHKRIIFVNSAHSTTRIQKQDKTRRRSDCYGRSFPNCGFDLSTGTRGEKRNEAIETLCHTFYLYRLLVAYASMATVEHVRVCHCSATTMNIVGLAALDMFLSFVLFGQDSGDSLHWEYARPWLRCNH